MRLGCAWKTAVVGPGRSPMRWRRQVDPHSMSDRAEAVIGLLGFGRAPRVEQLTLPSVGACERGREGRSHMQKPMGGTHAACVHCHTLHPTPRASDYERRKLRFAPCVAVGFEADCTGQEGKVRTEQEAPCAGQEEESRIAKENKLRWCGGRARPTYSDVACCAINLGRDVRLVMRIYTLKKSLSQK